MIKKYNQFLNERLGEEFEEEFPDTNQQESDLAARDLEGEISDFGDETSANLDMEEEEQPEEEGDIYQSRLQELANNLGVEVEDGKIMYNGKKIIFPSETEMYHVDNKKFKTSQEVISYLEGGSVEGGSIHRPQLPKNEIPQEEMELELQESKSYKYTRKFNKKR